MFTSIAGGFGGAVERKFSFMDQYHVRYSARPCPGNGATGTGRSYTPPRAPDEPIVKSSDFKRIFFESSVLSAGALSAYGYGIMRYGIGPQASTMAFMSLTSGQLLHALSCRSETHGIFDSAPGSGMQSNGYLNAALAGSFALQGLTLVVPGLRGLLGIAPLKALLTVLLSGERISSAGGK